MFGMPCRRCEVTVAERRRGGGDAIKTVLTKEAYAHVVDME